MTLAEAREKATERGVDLVLRNSKISPPIVKIMNYRKELLKRLFQKIGKLKIDFVLRFILLNVKLMIWFRQINI